MFSNGIRYEILHAQKPHFHTHYKQDFVTPNGKIIETIKRFRCNVFLLFISLSVWQIKLVVNDLCYLTFVQKGTLMYHIISMNFHVKSNLNKNIRYLA